MPPKPQLIDKPPGPGQQSPWTYQAEDVDGRILRITVPFDMVTRALISAEIYRDEGCRYQRILFGVGGDGRPDNAVRKLRVDPGTTNYTANQMSAVGLNVIEDILAVQITAGT